jgi:crotonobetainyl-CoA:carnitine CoA-transferase CaiB-like acyl-CoA transferase
LSSFIAGPFAAMMLGEMGAEVIKLEPPGGDLARAWGPFINGESRFFLAWNRNKRGLVADLTSDKGRRVLHALTRRSDVVIENFRPGVTKRLGADYETLSALNPGLIYASVTAFGHAGPESARPGYDPVLQSIGGSAHLNKRFNGGRAAICGIAVADFQAAMQVTTAVTAALYHRERTGHGQKIETSLLQAIMMLQPHYFVKPLDAAESGGLGIFPYRLFDTATAPLFVAGGTDKFWRLFCRAIGQEALGEDTRYATNSQRVRHAVELSAILDPVLAARSAEEWERVLVEAGVPCGPVLTHEEFFDYPQVQAMEMNPVIEHPVAGRLQMFGSPARFSETPMKITRAAPSLGQDTAEILRELGLQPGP